jgi:hypothetical protein
MRSLTLNEKISIKGVLSRYGVPSSYLVRLCMENAVWFFGQCTGRSITHYHLYHNRPTMEALLLRQAKSVKLSEAMNIAPDQQESPQVIQKSLQTPRSNTSNCIILTRSIKHFWRCLYVALRTILSALGISLKWK